MKTSVLAGLDDKLAALGMELGVPIGADGHGLGEDKYLTGLAELTKLPVTRCVEGTGGARGRLKSSKSIDR